MHRILIATLALALPAEANAQAVATDSHPWPPPGYACLRADREMQIDGVIDDEAWRHAPWTDAFTDILGQRRPAPRFRTRAKMLWDDECFYIAAELEEPHVWATLSERDSIIFHDNDFEVFIDPSADTHLYNEIEINALNTVWDLLLVRTYDDGGPAIHAWDIPGLRTAVRVQGTLNDPTDVDTGWTVEMAIPWRALAETAGVPSPPRVGDRWRVNFSRVQWRLDNDGGSYAKRTDQSGEPLPEDNWVWSEQRAVAMHEPEYWGIVEFRVDAVEPSVGPTETDRAVWRLRQVFNALRAFRRDHSDAPTSLEDLPDARSLLSMRGVPDGWAWPPSYQTMGGRWNLEMQRTDGALSVRMTEDGRIERRQ